MIPLYKIFISALALGYGCVAFSQTNDFGVGGVLDVPTARSPEENTFSATISRRDVADTYAITYQVMPRLEASFRYIIYFPSDVKPVPGSFCDLREAYCRNQFKDRSFEIKYRLFDESSYLPAVAIGLRDILGTGVFSGEYLTANKKVGNADFSLGLGWGRLAERAVIRNPLTYLSDDFETRKNNPGRGGEFNTSSYFRGANVGLFGSVRYAIPEWRIDLLAAYNSDSYARERRLGTLSSASPISYGLEWEATPGVRLTASWQQGNNLALKISTALDTGFESPRKPPNGFGATNALAASNPRDMKFGWFPRMAGDAEASGVLLRALQQEGDGVLRMRYSNMTYQMESDAIRRIMDLVELYAPRTVHTVELTGDSLALPTHTVRIARPTHDQMLPELNPPTISIGRPVELKRPTQLRKFKYPNGEMSAGITFRTYLFDPDAPLLLQPSLNLRGAVDFGGGWGLDGEWVQSLSNQFDRITRDGNSQLPPVRTDLKRYLQEGDYGIERLALLRRGKIHRDVYYQVFGGILEEMYSGVGAEVLWRRADLPFALGANVMAVRQRDFDKMFGLRDYQTVTGHVSGYWATGFHNFDVAIHAGRYLAKDVGATLEVQKRFANGWSVGAFATLTDVPFEVFGEGSFDKGLIFRVPIDSFSSRNSRGAFRTILRSINRDGGRMIENWSGQLWESMRPTHGDVLEDSRDRMVPTDD